MGALCPRPECFRVFIGGLGAVHPPALELGPWLAAAFTASRLLGQEMGLGRACGHWEVVGRKSGLPCAIRDNLDNVHLADMQKEHLQDAKEHSDECWVNSAVTCSTTWVFLCCLCAAVQGEKGRNTSAMMKSCRFNFKNKSAEKAWMLQAKAWGHASEMPLFMLGSLTICRCSSVLLLLQGWGHVLVEGKSTGLSHAGQDLVPFSGSLS